MSYFTPNLFIASLFLSSFLVLTGTAASQASNTSMAGGDACSVSAPLISSEGRVGFNTYWTDSKSIDQTLFSVIDVDLTPESLSLFRIDGDGLQTAAGAKVAVGQCRDGVYQEERFSVLEPGSKLAFSSSTIGRYRVKLSIVSPQKLFLRFNRIKASPPTIRALSNNGTAAIGSLNDTANEDLESGARYELFNLNLAPFERVIVEPTNALLQLDVAIGAGSDDVVNGYFTPDKGYQFRPKSSKVFFLSKTGGTQLIKVSGSKDIGKYQLNITRLIPRDVHVPATRITVGQEVGDELTLSDPAIVTQIGRAESPSVEYFQTFRPFKLYKIAVKTGQAIRFRMDADFDTLLQIGVVFPLARGFYALALNDDVSATVKSSGLTLKFDHDDDVIVRATAAREGQFGSFVLRTEQVGDVSAAPAEAPK